MATLGDNFLRVINLGGSAGGSGSWTVNVLPNGDRVYTDTISGTSFTVPLPVLDKLGDLNTNITIDSGLGVDGGDIINFNVDGVNVGSVEMVGGIAKWTLDGILDPIVYAGTPRTFAQRNAMPATKGYLVYMSDGTIEEYQYFDGTVWNTVGAQTPLVVTDSTSINFITSGIVDHNLTGEVKVSATAGNIISTNADGLYASATVVFDNQILNATDSNSIDLTMTPSLPTGADSQVDYTVQADVKINSSPFNTLSVTASGLLAAQPVHTLTSAVNTLTSGVDSTTNTVDIINSNTLTGNSASGIVSTINGIDATLTPPVGAIVDTLGFDSTGAIVKQTGTPSIVTADNGLTKIANNIELGGSLVQATSIDGANNSLSITDTQQTTITATGVGSLGEFQVNPLRTHLRWSKGGEAGGFTTEEDGFAPYAELQVLSDNLNTSSVTQDNKITLTGEGINLTLDTESNLKINGVTGFAGQVLTSNAIGPPTWKMVAKTVQQLNTTGNVTAWNSIIEIGAIPLTANIIITLPAISTLHIGKEIILKRLDNTAFTVTIIPSPFGNTTEITTPSVLNSRYGALTVTAVSATKSEQTGSIDKSTLTVVENKAALSALSPLDKDVVFVQDSVGLEPGLFIYDSLRAFGDVEPSSISKYTVTFDEITDIVTTSVPHTLTAGTIVRFSVTAPASPLTATTDYFIINPTATTFQVSTTSGGAAVNFNSPGSSIYTHYVSTKGGWFYNKSQVIDTYHQYSEYGQLQLDASTLFKVGDYIEISRPRQTFQVTKAGIGFSNILHQYVRWEPQGTELSNSSQFTTSFSPDVIKSGYNYYGYIDAFSAQPLVIGLAEVDGSPGYYPIPGDKMQFVIFNNTAIDKVIQFDSSYKNSTGVAIVNQTVPANGQLRIDFEGTWTSTVPEFRQLVYSSGGNIEINDWITATSYKIGDLVSTEGRVYKAITAHTSGVFNTDRANWNVVVPLQAGLSWAVNTYYYQNDIVHYAPRALTLKRSTSGTSESTFSNTEAVNWDLISSDELNTWTATTYYYLGEEIGYANKILKQVTGQVSFATFSAFESVKWQVTHSRIEQWLPNTFYYANEQVTNNGVLYIKASAGVTGATFDVTEELNWLRNGSFSSNPKIITAPTYTVLSNDEILSFDATSNNIVVTFPVTLPEGKFFTIHYKKTANSISFESGVGATIINPSTFLEVLSFDAIGSVGQVGTTKIFRLGTVFNFLG
jgi:hypothetical protein